MNIKPTLLNQTITIMERNNLEASNIDFIGSSDGNYVCSWEEFTSLAKDLVVDRFPCVANDLIIVFKDRSRLIRRSVDDLSEHWDYIKPFTQKPHPKCIKSLEVRWKNSKGWYLETIKEINKNLKRK